MWLGGVQDWRSGVCLWLHSYWPSGQEQRWAFSSQPIDRYWRFVEDQVTPARPLWMK
jgi:hypothetical protein